MTSWSGKIAYKRRFLFFAAAAIIIVGILLRSVQFLANRSLWLDESYIALNIVNKSFLELFNPLDYEQQAPIGFLLVTKLFVELFGNSEYSLRLFPFLVSIASLPLFYKMAKTFIAPSAVIVAIILFALSDSLIYFASEVKPYGIDLGIGVLVYVVAIVFMQKPKSQIFIGILLALSGSIALWFSQAVILELAGIGIALFLGSMLQKERKKTIVLLGVGASWLISFMVYYHIQLGEYLQNYTQVWTDVYAPLPPRSFADIMWYISSFSFMLEVPLGLSFPFISAVILCIGMYTMFLRSKFSFWLLIMPLVTTLIVSGFHRYPFSDRFLLFLAPSLLIFIAEGIYQTAKMAKKKGGILLLTLALLFCAPIFFRPVQTSIQYLFSPRMREEIRPCIEYYKNNRQEKDILYLYYASETAYIYYAPRYGLGTQGYIKGVAARITPSQYLFDLHKLKGSKRVWFLFSHVLNAGPVNEQQFFIRFLDSIGKRLISFNAQGASIYLYDLSN